MKDSIIELDVEVMIDYQKIRVGMLVPALQLLSTAANILDYQKIKANVSTKNYII